MLDFSNLALTETSDSCFNPTHGLVAWHVTGHQAACLVFRGLQRAESVELLIQTMREKIVSVPKWGTTKTGRGGADPFHHLPLFLLYFFPHTPSFTFHISPSFSDLISN